jgi:hypothetical protein
MKRIWIEAGICAAPFALLSMIFPTAFWKQMMGAVTVFIMAQLYKWYERDRKAQAQMERIVRRKFLLDEKLRENQIRERLEACAKFHEERAHHIETQVHKLKTDSLEYNLGMGAEFGKHYSWAQAIREMMKSL